MKEVISKITESELEVMRVLWKQSPQPLSAIRLSLERLNGWDSSTIKTLLRRLCDKGAVSVSKKDLLYYTPAISESEYSEYSTQQLINRLYQGSAKNLIASLVEGKKISENEIMELRKLFLEGE